MPTLRKSKSGGFAARVRIPKDVQEAYGRLYGKKLEAKFFAPADTKVADAKRRYGEWLAEHEARVESIRAERHGGGIPLTQRRAGTLAADWYRWFVAKHADNPGAPIVWEHRRDEVAEQLREFTSPEDYERDRPLSDEAIEAVLPLLADKAETQQFLALQRLTLNQEAHGLFLRAVFDQYAVALSRLETNARGDYSADAHAAKLPQPTLDDSGETPWELFEAWVRARLPAQGTVEVWRYMLQNLTDHFGGRSAGSLSTEDLREWLKSLIGPERAANTVYKTWKRAGQTVFQWAVDDGRLESNPFASIKAPKASRVRKRSDKHLRTDELTTILRASLAIRDTKRPDDAAKRWVPWLLGYSGARPSEITQLRGIDVTEQDGIPIIRLQPEAGTIKDREARDVPLHEHLLQQGFVEWVRARGAGPLFYAPRKKQPHLDRTRASKSPAAQARQRLADWVRSLGIDDPHLSPNHSWRHTFKVYARRANISEKYLDDICGHAAPSEGRNYGPTPLEDKAAAIARFPRYMIDEHQR